MKAEILRFTGPDVESMDVYNPTVPFIDREKVYLAARVESHELETDSKVLFFNETAEGWARDPETPVLEMQDPCITRIAGEWVIGGVKYPVGDGSWRTDFYRGRDLLTLELFASGPLGMKDIRPVELHDKRVGVFTRPQGTKGGRGKIGFTIVNSLDDLATMDYDAPPLIPGQFGDDTWGGPNEVSLLRPGKIGVLGHTAWMENEGTPEVIKHYMPMAFVYDYNTMEATPIEVIARRADFPGGPAKRNPELVDVVISGGLQNLGDGHAVFYAGLSDMQVGRIIIKDPFAEWR
ncbi:DUF1861 family protein [bacterium]|nr:DUF1861 family protein [bacterium]